MQMVPLYFPEFVENLRAGDWPETIFLWHISPDWAVFMLEIYRWKEWRKGEGDEAGIWLYLWLD